MFAVDSSTLIAFTQNDSGKDVALFTRKLLADEIVLPPAVISEVLSNPSNQLHLQHILPKLLELPLTDGYWQRAGLLRQKVLSHGFKARLGDTLIAQSCIDHGVELITRDTDFRHFAKWGKLKIAK